MTTMTPTGEGGGGKETSGSGIGNTDQTTNPSTPPAQQQQHQQHPPPSPLSGCYLLVVLPEPHTAQHKDLILSRLAKGFSHIFTCTHSFALPISLNLSLSLSLQLSIYLYFIFLSSSLHPSKEQHVYDLPNTTNCL
jgi:hypothetical protein